MAYRVFVSYSTKDFPLVERVKKLLEESSIDVFVAEHSVLPGSSLRETIISAIKERDLFILLWSRNSKFSEWVTQEIGVATSAGKTIIPVVLEKDLELPAFIKGIKYLPAYENPEDSLKWLQKNVFERAQKQEQTNGLIWLGIGAAILWLASQK